MNISRTRDVWRKNAIFYCLDAETFQDGDGVGDFAGLAAAGCPCRPGGRQGPFGQS